MALIEASSPDLDGDEKADCRSAARGKEQVADLQLLHQQYAEQLELRLEEQRDAERRLSVQGHGHRPRARYNRLRRWESTAVLAVAMVLGCAVV